MTKATNFSNLSADQLVESLENILIQLCLSNFTPSNVRHYPMSVRNFPAPSDFAAKWHHTISCFLIGRQPMRWWSMVYT